MNNARLCAKDMPVPGEPRVLLHGGPADGIEVRAQVCQRYIIRQPIITSGGWIEKLYEYELRDSLLHAWYVGEYNTPREPTS
jgi:hypothetical protein